MTCFAQKPIQFLGTMVVLSAVGAAVPGTMAQSRVVFPRMPNGTARTPQTHGYALQVGAFVSYTEAEPLIGALKSAGASPVISKVQIPGRGSWVRVLLGSFGSVFAAKHYAKTLTGRGLIKEFFVKPDEEYLESKGRYQPERYAPSRAEGSRLEDSRLEESSRARRAFPNTAVPPASPLHISDSASQIEVLSAHSIIQSPGQNPGENPGQTAGSPIALPRTRSASNGPSLPIADRLIALARTAGLTSALTSDLTAIESPRFNPEGRPRQDRAERITTSITRMDSTGGLWITGETEKGLAWLRWIAGDRDARFVNVGSDGRVSLDKRGIEEAAGVLVRSRPEFVGLIDQYIRSNEGLTLLVQVTQGRYKYELHIGHSAMTAAGETPVISVSNLDNNFDSRINPRRHLGEKLPRERPRAGFDSLVALNPEARWVNLQTGRLLPIGLVAFHELAEAYSKLELGLDYLPAGPKPGAHETALARERRLRDERPDQSGQNVTEGLNRVFETNAEYAKYQVESRTPRWPR